MSTTIDPHPRTRGFKPDPVSARVFVRCYRQYGEAKHAYDVLRVVAGIPDKRMTVVARGLEWHESLPAGRLYKLACALAAFTGAIVAVTLYALGLAAGDTHWLTQSLFGAMAGCALGFVGATVVARLRARRGGGVATGHVEPRQFDILVEEELAPTALDVLARD
jgi:hypothetical protein